MFCDNQIGFGGMPEVCPNMCKGVRNFTKKMATLEELCGGLPLNPLPPWKQRDPDLPHAPVRTPALTPADRKVNNTVSGLKYSFYVDFPASPEECA